MDKQKTIEFLQYAVTSLGKGAFAHYVQGKVFASQGLSKLGEKYIGHHTEEMGWVDKLIERILDLGGEVKVEERTVQPVYTDPVEYIKWHLDAQQKGVAQLTEAMQQFAGDPTTYDLLKDYLKDEEEDLYWDQRQLELIEKIGVQNWLVTQI